MKKLITVLLTINMILTIAMNFTIEVQADSGNETVTKLIISKNDFSNGIRWTNGDEGTMADPEIYIDPVTEAMFIEAEGGVYINGVLIE